MFKKYYNFIIFGVFLLVWFWSGWHPVDPRNWFVENHLIFLFMPVLLFLVAYVRISKISFTLILTFLALHLVGAHYDYGFVPFGENLSQMFHSPRNSYDRFAHFSFGALMVYPIFEILSRFAKLRRFWKYAVSFAVVLALSATYEILEWITVSNLEPHAGYLFIGGTDLFDAPKDMAISCVGAFIALVIVAIFYRENTRNKRI